VPPQPAIPKSRRTPLHCPCAILELLYAGGLRVGEIVALGEEDLHLDQARAQVRGKGDKERIVPLGRRAVQALDEYVKRGRPALARGRMQQARMEPRALFLSVRGRPLTRQWVWEMVRNAYGRSDGARKASPHMLRHSCATHMVEHGADLSSACSATPTSPRRRSTPTSPWSTSSASTATTIRAAREGREQRAGNRELWKRLWEKFHWRCSNEGCRERIRGSGGAVSRDAAERAQRIGAHASRLPPRSA
jgi:integrase